MRTNKDRKEFLEILKEYPIISIACRRAKIDKATIYRWLKRNRKFANQVEHSLGLGRNAVSDLAESQLITSIRNGDQKSIKFWLENNCKRYVKPRPVNIFNNLAQGPGNKITFTNFSGKVEQSSGDRRAQNTSAIETDDIRDEKNKQSVTPEKN
ncbi:MAG: hypothetical protein WC845_03830 [Candidatus Staskawiczbacteria bacterium]|jgi:hypothetical protein